MENLGLRRLSSSDNVGRQSVLYWLRNADAPEYQSDWLVRLAESEPEEFEDIFDSIDLVWNHDPPIIAARWNWLVQNCVSAVLRQRKLTSPGGMDSPAIEVDVVYRMYCRSLSDEDSATSADTRYSSSLGSKKRHATSAHFLQILAAQADLRSLKLLCEFLRESPPADWHSVALAISPFFQFPPDGIGLFFEELGECALQASTAGPLLDLANYLVRRNFLTVHPLTERLDSLLALLGGLVARLGKLEENPRAFGDDVQTVQNILADSLSLTVSVCDALGLIGNTISEGKLNQAMALSHRRIQAEAAGALARFGNAAGKQRLIELASEPVARLRALAYAEELGFDHEIADDYREPLARAEGSMAAWLAESDQFGFPPNELQLIDQRSQFWPSYEEPQDCYLWRFTYELPGGSYSNIGITGPMNHAFRANLADMCVDDIYAIFAGWLVQHDEIFEVPSHNFNSAQRAEASRLEKILRDKGVDQIEPLALTFFFGERSILALGVRNQQKICAVTDTLETILFSIGKGQSSLNPDLLLALYRGRKMLRTFNPAHDLPDDSDSTDEFV